MAEKIGDFQEESYADGETVAGLILFIAGFFITGNALWAQTQFGTGTSASGASTSAYRAAATASGSNSTAIGAMANAGVAMAGIPGQNKVALGTSVMGSQVGVGVAYQRSFTGGWSGTLSVSTNGSSDYTQVGGAVGFGF